MRMIAILICIACFASCSEPGVKVTIKNVSNTLVDSVTVASRGDEITIKKTAPGQESTGVLFFTKKTRGDGSYKATVFRNGKSEGQSFGYYTNGSPMSQYIDITVYNDTIKAEEKDSELY